MKLNFPQNDLLSFQQTYSKEFFIVPRASESPLLIWCELSLSLNLFLEINFHLGLCFAQNIRSISIETGYVSFFPTHLGFIFIVKSC